MQRSEIFLFIIIVAILAACFSCGDDSGSSSDDDSSSQSTDAQVGSLHPRVFPDAFDPGLPGPYAVGNTTRLFYDTSRDEALYGGPRPILTEFWYPVLPEDAVGNFERPRDMLFDWADLVIRIFSFVLPPDEADNFDIPTGSIRDLPIAPDGPYPVVIYSHGNGGVRFQAFTWCEHLASHGFVVISPDHPSNAAVTPLPDRLIIYNPILFPFDLFRRQGDLMFLLTKAKELNENDPEGFFTGMLDYENAAVSGHSFGGNTTLEVLRQDPRFKVGITFAGPDVPIISDNMYNLMTFIAMEDHTLPDYIPLFELIHDWAIPPKAMVKMYDSGHYTFTNICDLIPSLMGTGDGCGEGERLRGGGLFEFLEAPIAWRIINTYTTAWLSWHLKGEDFSYTLTHNRFPRYMDYEYQFE